MAAARGVMTVSGPRCSSAGGRSRGRTPLLFFFTFVVDEREPINVFTWGRARDAATQDLTFPQKTKTPFLVTSSGATLKFYLNLRRDL